MNLLTSSAVAEPGRFWGFDDARSQHHGLVWKLPVIADDDPSYRTAVETVFETFSMTTGKQLAPARYRRAAIKVYANSGPGLHTPHGLTRAVISALEARGFHRAELMIIDARESMLRASGYLPPLSRMPMEGPIFEGVPVYGLDEGSLRSETWFYESPVPREFTSPIGRQLFNPQMDMDPTEARRSYLPSKLLTEVDFWINLPMACHHPVTEMSGAVVNASLWNITNNMRFFNSPANAPVAVAEIAAIPEILDTWALNLISLEAYQFIGGPAFNAHYTRKKQEIWASVDPVILDSALTDLINHSRRENGFRPLSTMPEFIDLSMRLGLGFGHPAQLRVERLQP